MSRVSRSFKRAEFACKCDCGFDTVDVELVVVLQDVRDHFNAPVTITSGCRCAKHNRREGGAKGSLHLIGRAADIVVEGHSTREVHDYLAAKYPNRYGIAWHRSFVHIDTRTNGPARWDY